MLVCQYLEIGVFSSVKELARYSNLRLLLYWSPRPGFCSLSTEPERYD